MATIKYKSPYGKISTRSFRAFKLESEPKANCYVCHVPLSDEEKRHESTFTYFNKDGDVLKTIKTYACFDCIEILTGRRPYNE